MSKEANRSGFIAVGSVRGWCGHIHRTKEGASGCAERDQRSCQKVRGYSDLTVRRVELGESIPTR